MGKKVSKEDPGERKLSKDLLGTGELGCHASLDAALRFAAQLAPFWLPWTNAAAQPLETSGACYGKCDG
jgi:hypothetical protein